MELPKDLFGQEIKADTSFLGARFITPPFTVLSARDGWWQERKRLWLALGIQSELGRGANVTSLGGGDWPPRSNRPGANVEPNTTSLRREA